MKIKKLLCCIVAFLSGISILYATCYVLWFHLHTWYAFPTVISAFIFFAVIIFIIVYVGDSLI